MARVAVEGRRLAVRAASVAAALAVWQVSASLDVVSDFLLPSPGEIALRLVQDVADGSFLGAAVATLLRTAAGFAIAAVAGITIGLLIARVAAARWFFDPLVSIGLPTPKIAFLPIFVLWFGIFDTSKILMAAFNAVFPIIVATAAGTQAVDKFILWSAAGMGAGRGQMLWGIALPAALPSILTGLQIALPISLIVIIVSEMATGADGLGGSMILAMRLADSPGVFSGIVGTALVGLMLLKSVELLRRRLLVWHEEAAT